MFSGLPIENLDICSDYDGKQTDARPELETQDPTSLFCTNNTDSKAINEENVSKEREVARCYSCDEKPNHETDVPFNICNEIKEPLTSEGHSSIEKLNICSDYDEKQKDAKSALETQDPTSTQCVKTNESDPLAKDEKSILAVDRDAPSRSFTGKHCNMELRT